MLGNCPIIYYMTNWTTMRYVYTNSSEFYWVVASEMVPFLFRVSALYIDEKRLTFFFSAKKASLSKCITEKNK